MPSLDPALDAPRAASPPAHGVTTLAALHARWRALDHRPARFAGAVYPDEPSALARVLDGWIRAAARQGDVDASLARAALATTPTGEGASGATGVDAEAAALHVPLGPARAAASDPPPSSSPGTVALLSPHIDYLRGGRSYGGAWARAAAAARAAELVIVVGTDHGGPPGSVTLCRQRYATPYGTLPTAVEVVDAAAEAYGAERAFAGELRHLGEHSVELVLTWLQHVRRGRPVPLVPLVVGGFEGYEGGPEAPERDAPLMALVEVLRRAVAERPALVVASGDLAHVGPAFGGAAVEGAGRARLAGVDGELLRRLEAADAAGFLAAIQRVGNANNVCGVAPAWLALQVARPRGGTVMGYQQCPADAAGRSWVSVAGVAWEA